LISTSSRQYYIIVGPRGCGKSTAVTQASVGKEGVARVTVTTANANVLEKVAKKFGVASPYYNFAANANVLEKVAKKFGVASPLMEP
jgi:ABC-type lipoprotein export system ATPase subunit